MPLSDLGGGGGAEDAQIRDTTSLELFSVRRQGAINLPRIRVNKPYNLFNSFRAIFRDLELQIFLLDSTDDGALHCLPLFCMLSSRVSDMNFASLKHAIRDISFHELRDPKENTDTKLHDAREDLDNLRAVLTSTLSWDKMLQVFLSGVWMSQRRTYG